MRRAITVLIVTVAVLVLLANFRTHAPALNAATPTTKRSGQATAGTARSSSGTAASGTAAPARKTAATATATGTPVSTQYGTVQVKVTKANGRITAVTPVTLSANDSRSQEIDAQAEPILRQEALQAQSASIDAVSGATYTSDAYVQSLQAALDRVAGQNSSS